MKVLAGRLTDEDRRILFESNRAGGRVLVATLHACIEYSQHRAPGCEEPYQAVGVVTTWDHDSFKLGGWSFTVNIPWVSAIKVWRRAEAPSEEDVAALIAEHACRPPTREDIEAIIDDAEGEVA